MSITPLVSAQVRSLRAVFCPFHPSAGVWACSFSLLLCRPEWFFAFEVFLFYKNRWFCTHSHTNVYKTTLSGSVQKTSGFYREETNFRQKSWSKQPNGKGARPKLPQKGEKGKKNSPQRAKSEPVLRMVVLYSYMFGICWNKCFSTHLCGGMYKTSGRYKKEAIWKPKSFWATKQIGKRASPKGGREAGREGAHRHTCKMQ